MFNCRSVDFKTLSVPFTCARSKVLCVAIDVIADVGNAWSECIVPIGCDIYTWNVRFDSGLILSYFLNYFTFHVTRGNENGFRCIVEIGGSQGCALATSLHKPAARRAGSSTKAQPCVPLISSMHIYHTYWKPFPLQKGVEFYKATKESMLTCKN